jgi:hypothetical protein
MRPQQRKFVILHSFILCAMIVCAFFSFRHASSHHSPFRLTFLSLLFINSLLLYRYSSKRPQPDTLIHLFPKFPKAKEGIIS